ncbi:MAG: hypothetical protein CMI31_01840 [Opitutae bacterium]|nr:hypothetical protein [Opitutae bacterium]
MGCCGIVSIEQILYRFSDGYAKARADWLWGINQKSDELSWFKVFPFDQWQSFPTHDGKATLETRLNAESEYAQTSLSHTRALRDNLYQELLSSDSILPAEMPALANEEKLGEVLIMVPLTQIGIQGILLRVLPPKSAYQPNELKSEHRDIERQFIPMLRESFACGIVHVDNETELLSAVKDLNKMEKSIPRRILAWGKGKAANILAKVASDKPDAFTLLVLDSPLMTMPPCPANGPSVLFFIDENTSSPVAWNSLEWADRLRSNKRKSGADRFSCLLTDGRTTARDADSYRLALAYGFITEVARLSPVGTSHYETPLMPDGFPPVQASTGNDTGHSKITQPQTPAQPEVPTIPVNIPPVEDEPSFPLDQANLYDCKVVRDFRKLNTNPRYRDLTNKDLILILGKQFEAAGALERLRELDIRFVEYYENFKLMAGPEF